MNESLHKRSAGVSAGYFGAVLSKAFGVAATEGGVTFLDKQNSGVGRS